MKQPDAPTSDYFLFIGDADQAGPADKIKATGSAYVKKRLESGVENWERIISLMESEFVQGILVKLTRATYEKLADSNYDSVSGRLLEALRHKPHIVFAHQSILNHKEHPEGPKEDVPRTTPEEWVDDTFMDEFSSDFFTPLDPAIFDHVRSLFDANDILVTPYESNAEMSVLANLFLDQHEQNLIFRIYIPKDRMWARETEKLLQLFREYLNQVGNLRVAHQQYATSKGVIHEFTADKAVDPTSLPEAFSDFTKTLDLSATDPSEARKLLVKKNLNDSLITEIVDRYSKEAKRLHIDMKQQREVRILSIRHRLEAELAEVINVDDWAEIYTLVDDAVPNSLGFGAGNLLSEKTAKHAQNIINIKPQYINQVNGIVGSEISGNISLGAEAGELLKLIDEYGGSRTADLKASAHELADIDVKRENRLAARQKLKAFLATLGSKVGDTALSIGQKYLESLIGL